MTQLDKQEITQDGYGKSDGVQVAQHLKSAKDLVITGFLASNLAGIDIDHDVQIGEDMSKTSFGIIEEQIDTMLQRIPLQEQTWDIRIASDANGDPVYVVGFIHKEGESPPTMPAKLARLFDGRLVQKFRLRYPEDDE